MKAPWVQVLGAIAIHQCSGDVNRLTGSRARLLSVLVAAGRGGASAERIAEELWGEGQPNPWRPALRMAVARLRKLLPDEWDITAEAGGYQILVVGEGWIDAWRLEEYAGNGRPILQKDLPWMLDGPPFGDNDLLGFVAANIEHLRLLQVGVAERFCAQRPDRLTTTTCSALTALLRGHPYNERLALDIATAMSGGGRRAEAVAALSQFADHYAAEFGATNAKIGEFLASEPSGGLAHASPVTPTAGRSDTQHMPKELRHLQDATIVGRSAELHQLMGSSRALVLGPSGSGKSRLVAALIVHIDESTTYICGDDRLDLPFGPFIAALPSIRSELVAADADDSLGAEGSLERAASTRAGKVVLEHLRSSSPDRLPRLIVDDAHLLDPASLSLVQLLMRSKPSEALSILVVGRTDIDDDTWAGFVTDAERTGVRRIELRGLDGAEIDKLVYQHFPDATVQTRRGLASDVLEASGGLPGVVAPLIAASDPDTLALPEQLVGGTGLARLTSTVSESALEVCGVASVLGMEFAVGALILLVDLPERQAFDGLDELMAAGLLVETDDADRVRFRHLLIQRAFNDVIPAQRRSQLHMRAADLTPDTHERAWHLSNAGSLVEAREASSALVASAQLYAKNRQWRRTARQLRRADRLRNVRLDARTLSLWATALDRAGADGARPRRRAFQLALADQNWSQALDAALTGLPEAERADGDLERIDMFESIPVDRLAPERRFDLVLQLGRQYALAGDYATALEFADEAILLASEPDEVGLSNVCRWTATRHVQPVPITFAEHVLQGGSLPVRTRVAQMSALGAVERGDYSTGSSEADRFGDLAVELGDPLRIWHSMVLRSLFVFNRGELDAGEKLAAEARDYATVHGLGQAAATGAGQLAHSRNVQGRLGELWPMLEPYRVNMAQSSYGSSMLVLAQVSAGVTEPDPSSLIKELAISAVQRPRSPSLVVAAFISGLLGDYAPDLIQPVHRFLSRFGDNPIVVGFGLADLGPALRYTANLEPDPAQQLAVRAATLEAADRHGTRLWRVVTRLDMAAATGKRHWVEQAAELAEGTDLQAVVERFGDRT